MFGFGRWAVGAMLVGALVTGQPSALSAAADTASSVTSNTGSVAIDAANAETFYDTGGDSTVRVTKSGNVAGTVDTVSLDGPVAGLVASPGGATVYAAIPGSDEIEAIQAGNLQASPVRYPTDVDGVSASCPMSLAMASTSALWFSYGCGTSGALGTLDTITGAVTDFPATTQAGAPAQLSSTSAAPSTLVALDPSTSPSSTYAWDVSGTSPTLLGSRTQATQDTDSFRSAAVSHDGASVYAVDDSQVDQLSLPGLTVVATTPADSGGHLDAVASVGRFVVVGGTSDSSSGTTLGIYTAAGLCEIQTNPASGDVVLALAADGSQSSAAIETSAPNGSEPSAEAVDLSVDPLTTSINVDYHDRRKTDGTVVISGVFSRFCSGSSDAVTLHVHRYAPVGSTTTPHRFTVRTAPDGSFSVTDPHPSDDAATYYVGYPGNAENAASTATVDLPLLRVPLSLHLAVPRAAVQGQGGVVVITANVDGKPITTDIRVVVHAAYGGATHRLGAFTVSNGGRYLVLKTPDPGDVAVTATFAGDERYHRASAGITLPVVRPTEVAVFANAHHKAELLVGHRVTSLGATVIGAPSVLDVGSLVLITATFPDHRVYERTQTSAWQKLETSGPACVSGPAATIVRGRVEVACEGRDHRVWHASAAWTSQLPTPGSAWHRLGRRITSAPAVATQDQSLIIFVKGTHGHLLSWQSRQWVRYVYVAAAAPGFYAASRTSAIVYIDGQHRLNYVFCRGSACRRPAAIGTGFIGQPSTFSNGRCQVLFAIDRRGRLERAQACDTAAFAKLRFRVVARGVVDGVTAIYT